ncbi:WD40 repeat-like protein [Pseudovirgaria hyperparasitica]|uniref:WD40 repeat-like protein n=1 Tax=Pseudovirgaria hyperparasitica TaxID=470096 RepID=A0A6A6WGQ1_9PEZI|nr:WD40 repeat-like protein [Pseudovirgaria hyperparasitica]KAF2761389.1 WD40 repeat-like protein [Pseudovirgaria hyperparasitica]
MSTDPKTDTKKRKRPVQDNMNKDSPRQTKKSKKALANGTWAGKASTPKQDGTHLKAEVATPVLNGQVNVGGNPQKIAKKHKTPGPNGVTETKAEEPDYYNTRDNSIQDPWIDTDDVSKRALQMKTTQRRASGQWASGENVVARTDTLQSQTIAPRESWKLSKSIGGRFLDRPPIFSADEKYLILANAREVHVYETSTSLLTRRIQVSGTKSISSLVLSQLNPENLYVATLAGHISLWHWPSGTIVQEIHREYSIINLSISSGNASGGETIYTVEDPKQAKSDYEISAHRLSDRNDVSSTMVRTTPKVPNMVKALSGGNVLFVSFGNVFSVGEIEKGTSKGVPSTYTWREIETPSNITCFDVFASSLSSLDQGSSNMAQSQAQIDVAFGLEDGRIFVHEDLPSKLAAFDTHRNKNRVEPRILHWHRRAVGSLTWSADGLYLISGGQETVLCLWNVDNAKRSELPHLVAPIQQIVISPRSSSYAISLGDNSVIVLSTADLKATTNIAGLQAQFARSDARSGGKPFLLDPSKPNQALFAVPASMNTSSCPYIQRFDISTGRHIMRQAVARSNATSSMDTPGAKLVEEPNVTLMQLSCDGMFMATLEEWAPPVDDLKHVVNGTTKNEERDARREIHLKFWRVDESSGSWRLITRIEAPHILEDGYTSGEVFAMVSNPQEVGFATLGEDGNVKIWTPKRKNQDGSLVRSASGEAVFWSSRYSVALERNVHQLEDYAKAGREASNASLAYSSDGSLLAATLDVPNGPCNGLVHMISAETGRNTTSLPGLYAQDLISIGILQRYLVVLSESLTVWDMVNDELVFSRGQDINLKKHFATNPIDMTFAVSYSGVDWDLGRDISRVSIFAVNNCEPLDSVEVPNMPISLQATPGSNGYALLDHKAEIRIISAASATSITVYDELAAMPEAGSGEVDAAEIEDEEDEEMVEEDELENAGDNDLDELEDEENDKPIVRQQQLADIFDVGPSYALPPVKDMFKAITSLYARKPTAQALS